MERKFELIDGNMAKASHIVAYCTLKHGCLTKGLISTHRCGKKRNGNKCPRFEALKFVDPGSRRYWC